MSRKKFLSRNTEAARRPASVRLALRVSRSSDLDRPFGIGRVSAAVGRARVRGQATTTARVRTTHHLPARCADRRCRHQRRRHAQMRRPRGHRATGPQRNRRRTRPRWQLEPTVKARRPGVRRVALTVAGTGPPAEPVAARNRRARWRRMAWLPKVERSSDLRPAAAGSGDGTIARARSGGPPSRRAPREWQCLPYACLLVFCVTIDVTTVPSL